MSYDPISRATVKVEWANGLVYELEFEPKVDGSLTVSRRPDDVDLTTPDWCEWPRSWAGGTAYGSVSLSGDLKTVHRYMVDGAREAHLCEQDSLTINDYRKKHGLLPVELGNESRLP